MKEDFINFNYLEFGSKKQQKAFKLLNNIQIFDIIAKYNLILVGTIPIGVDIDNSDLVRQKIIELKKSGLKTEPAFSKLLNLKGNPYDELLKLEKLSDVEIINLVDFAM